MLVARSFSYEGSNKQKPSKSPSEKDVFPKRPIDKHHKVRGFGWRPESFLRAKADPPTLRHLSTSDPSGVQVEQDQRSRSTSPDEDVALPASPSASSRPVAVPQRRRRRSANGTTRRRSPDHTDNHNADAMSPSVAALLAMTQIPRRKTFRPTRPSYHSLPPRMSIAELRKEWDAMDRSHSESYSSSPTMDLLLSPPDERDEPPFEPLDDDVIEYKFSRSVSNESMPSLDNDDRSVASWLSPPTPSGDLKRRPSSMRKPRAVSSPKTFDSATDHPLLRIDSVEEIDLSKPRDTSPSRRSSKSDQTHQKRAAAPERRQSRFRSNLTASITALRSAARSLSNFAAPSILPEDHLSSGFFSNAIPYRPELRPQPLDSPPNAQLRRYLNPHAFQLYDFHLHNSHLDHTDLPRAAAAIANPDLGVLPADIALAGSVIPLQDYAMIQQAKADREAAEAATASGQISSALTEAGRSGVPMQHRREPRENAEFLRVCVLEMQMLRAGKIQGPIGVKPGRRAFWLPPRSGFAVVEKRAQLGKDVPRRWRGEVPADEDLEEKI